MREQRLLERISRLAQGEERSHLTQTEMLITSIVEHLQRVLNTRQGSVPIDPQFGVPEFTHIASSFQPDSITKLVDNIVTMIRRYEPRLKRVTIVPLTNEHNPLTLGFSLEAAIEVDNQDIPIRLITYIASNGRTTLKR